jgi:ribose 5-phosphate isomerase
MHARDAAARAAVAEAQADMVVGLGTGDTAERAIRALAERRLSIVCVATSQRSASLASSLGMTLREPDEVTALDLTIDGADAIGGLIADCRIAGDAAELARAVKSITGVVEHGLFLDEAAAAYIGRRDGTVEVRARS